MGFCAHRKFLTLVWYGCRLFSVGYDEKHLARLDTCFRRSQRGRPGVRGHRSRIEPRMLSARAARGGLRARRSGVSGPTARLFRVCQSTTYRRDPRLRPEGFGAASRLTIRRDFASGNPCGLCIDTGEELVELAADSAQDDYHARWTGRSMWAATH